MIRENLSVVVPLEQKEIFLLQKPLSLVYNVCDSCPMWVATGYTLKFHVGQRYICTLISGPQKQRGHPTQLVFKEQASVWHSMNRMALTVLN